MVSDGVKVSLEGVGAAEEVVHNDSHAPDIDFGVIGVSCPYLRCHVDGCAAVGGE